MNYSIEFTNVTHSFLTVSPRKKTLKNELFTSYAGNVLVKIGKKEYAVEQGQYFWIPANCLVSTTYLPGAAISSISFSQRLPDQFSTNVGYVNSNEIVIDSFNLLSKQTTDKEYSAVLQQVIRHEMRNTSVQLKMSALSQQFNNWSETNKADLSSEVNLLLLLREARKRILSGKKPEQVATELFGLSLDEFNSLYKSGLGTTY